MKRKPLTDTQHRLYQFIRREIQRTGVAPTLQEIADSFRIGKVTAWEHVQELKRKGWVRAERRRARSIQLVGKPTTVTCPNCRRDFELART